MHDKRTSWRFEDDRCVHGDPTTSQLDQSLDHIAQFIRDRVEAHFGRGFDDKIAVSSLAFDDFFGPSFRSFFFLKSGR